MDPLWMTLSYLVTNIRHRVRAALDGDPESGAMSLEWIVIAVGLVVVAGVAVALITAAVRAEANQLP